LTKKARKGGLILAVVLGLFIAIGRSNVYLEANDMLASGITTDATVVKKKHWTETGKKGRELDRYALVYQFTDSSGKTMANEVRVNEESYAQATDGGTVSIVYKASAPNVNDTRRHYEHKASIGNIVRDVLVLMAIIIGAGYAIGFLVRSKMQKQLSVQTPA